MITKNTTTRISTLALALTIGLGTALTGCASTTAESDSHEAITLYEPASQTLQRGSTNKLLVVVSRSNVDGPLWIDVSELPSGVDVVESEPRIFAGDKTGTVTLHANEDAELTTGHPIRIEVKDGNGLSVSEWVEIDVVARN